MKTTTKRAEKIAEMMDRDDWLTARAAADRLDFAVRQSAAEIIDCHDGEPANMSDTVIEDARRALRFADESELSAAVAQAVADYDDNLDGDADDEGNVYTTSYVNETTIDRLRAALK